VRHRKVLHGLITSMSRLRSRNRVLERYRHRVVLAEGSVIARPPTGAEARRFRIPRGGYVLVIRRREVAIVVPADRVEIMIRAAAH
jgi:uncharacterized membrane protein